MPFSLCLMNIKSSQNKATIHQYKNKIIYPIKIFSVLNAKCLYSYATYIKNSSRYKYTGNQFGPSGILTVVWLRQCTLLWSFIPTKKESWNIVKL